MAICPFEAAPLLEEAEPVLITSAVCAPALRNTSHTVFSCVVADDMGGREALECKISMAPNLEEGVVQGCAQAMELLRRARASGREVSGIHCSHCPSQREPKCGTLARLPRYPGETKPER